MPSVEQYFVTGTDTEIGKTTVTAGLLAAARRQQRKTLALKPIAAGCRFVDGGWVNDDALLLQQAASEPLPYSDVNPISLTMPVAPHIAAARENRVIDMHMLVEHCRAIERQPIDLMLVEGVGGWEVPVDEYHTTADFAAALGYPVILVVGIRLGCLNHALLTTAAIGQRGLVLAGWVANCVDANTACKVENIDFLVRKLPAPCLGVVPYCHEPTADHVAACLQLEKLIYAGV